MGCSKPEHSELPTVLYVDDEPLACKYFAETLKGTANVVTAGSAAEARTVMEQSGGTLDAIVSDERMPAERGVELLSQARHVTPLAKRVLTSAYSDVDSLQTAINDAAVHHFLPKPWDVTTLPELMRDVLSTTQDVAIASPLDIHLLQPLQSAQADAIEMMTLVARQTTAPRQFTGGVNFSSNLLQLRAARVQKSVAACLALVQGGPVARD